LSEWNINTVGCCNIILWIIVSLRAFVTTWFVRGIYCTAMYICINWNNMFENKWRASVNFWNTTTCINRTVILTRELLWCDDFLQLVVAWWWPREAETCGNRWPYEWYFVKIKYIYVSFKIKVLYVYIDGSEKLRAQDAKIYYDE
jgi:hypothetical protein